ncbi:MAG: fibronectin type III-like domain-contianing protein, partial [Lachnospiraceae bacterium]|nr:fibronectin type III-like domain-contianing protein [Lachnospiraceae bacterium]
LKGFQKVVLRPGETKEATITLDGEAFEYYDEDFFSLKEYQELAYKAIDDIILRGRQPFLVGGTGLYVNAVADGYELSDAPVDAELRAKVEAMSL